MKIGIIKHREAKGGPQIFLERFAKQAEQFDDVQIRNAKFPFFELGLYNSFARNIYRKPYVLRLDGIYYNLAMKIDENKRLNNEILNSMDGASGIIFQSQFSKDLVEKHISKVSIPNIIIPNGAPYSSEKVESREDLNLPEDKIMIIASAKWRRWKRLEEIIKVFDLANEVLQNLYLIVVGDGIEQKVQNKNVKYIGNIPHQKLSSYYKNSDLMIHLAWLDNCPNTVVEALVNGLPVLSSNQGGTKELIKLANGGVISNTDEQFEFNFVDLNKPPKIDYCRTAEDLICMVNNLEKNKKDIISENVNIKLTSKKYLDFLRKVYNDKY